MYEYLYLKVRIYDVNPGYSSGNLFAHDSQKMDLKDLLVIGDSVRLAQVFRNVVSNALKYSSSGMQVAIKAVWCPQHLSKQGRGSHK